MDGFDLVIIVCLLVALVRGMQVGFVRQFCSTFGFVVGLAIGALAQYIIPHQWLETAGARTILILLSTLGVALVGMTLGEYFGTYLKLRLKKIEATNEIDRIMGSALAGITILGAFWLGSALFRNAPVGLWQRQLQGSRIVAVLNNTLPSAPNLIARIGNLIDPNSFPQVFTGLEPKLDTDAPLPELGDLRPAVEHARASVVKLQGQGCGGVVVGSGFIGAKDLVVTNAHVVAGVSGVQVVDTTGAHKATTVWFDPELDLAILRANNLAGPPLELNTSRAQNGTSSAALGYPGGHGFTVSLAAVLDSFIAIGRDIYGQGRTERQVYSVKADIEEGNSGGPLIDANGEVIGVIFARSTSYDDVGYALTASQVVSPLAAAATAQPVPTGACSE